MTSNIDLVETIQITLSSMFIVFLILILLAFLVSLFKFLPHGEQLATIYNKKSKKEYVPFEKMDEDMKVAVLVATVACKSDSESEVVLKSVRKL